MRSRSRQSPYLCALQSRSIRMSSSDDSAEAEHIPLRAIASARAAPRRATAAAISVRPLPPGARASLASRVWSLVDASSYVRGVPVRGPGPAGFLFLLRGGTAGSRGHATVRPGRVWLRLLPALGCGTKVAHGVSGWGRSRRSYPSASARRRLPFWLRNKAEAEGERSGVACARGSSSHG